MGMPLAAGLDWLEAILPLLFVGFWIISQIVTALRKLGQAVNRGAAPPPLVEPAGEKGALALEDELREFLERVARSQRPAGPETAAPPPLPRAPQSAPAPRPEPLAQRSVSDATTAKRASGGPAHPLRRASQDQPLGLQSPAIGSGVAAHVRDVFGHELRHLNSPLAGEIHDEPGSKARSRSVAAGRILDLLRSPTTIRDLIVIREILDRPATAADSRGRLL